MKARNIPPGQVIMQAGEHLNSNSKKTFVANECVHQSSSNVACLMHIILNSTFTALENTTKLRIFTEYRMICQART